VFSTDIEDFFQSTGANVVAQALEDLGYPTHGAQLIVNLTTLNGNLAQGSPASPVLSNLAFRPLDEEIIALCARLGVNYSRYADDLVISGTDAVPEGLQQQVKEIVEVGNWKLSEAKTELVRSPNRLKVYGLLVNGKKPRLTKGYRRRVRAIRHLLDAGRISEERLAEALGHISYANSVERFEPPSE